jgi:choice-of-anchor B domain-containing protein
LKFFLFLFLLPPLVLISQTSNLILHDHWYKENLTTTADGESIFNEVWGLEYNNENYAVIGSTMGTHILKIENNQLLEIDFIEGKYAGYQAVHRDYHDFNGYLYAVCDENLSSLQIIDLSYLPDSVHLVYDSDTLITRAHNIFIDTAKAKMYACAVTTQSGFHAMNIYNLNNPVSPDLICSYDEVGHVHDAYVYNDTAYLNCASQGLKVVKSNNNGTIIQIGELNFYPDKDYNHSGWINKSKTTYLMCDEAPGKDVKVLDISDLNDIQVNSLFNSEMGDDESSIPHNVIIRNNIAYLSYYHDGLQIFDIGNSSQPKKIAFYDTYLPNPSVAWAGAWGVYPFVNNDFILVSDRTYGLFLLSFEPPPSTANDPYFVFPNPASNYIYFHKEHIGASDYLLNIYNSLGQLVDQFNCSTYYYKINLSKYKTGIYILEYISNFDSPSIKTKFFVK